MLRASIYNMIDRTFKNRVEPTRPVRSLREFRPASAVHTPTFQAYEVLHLGVALIALASGTDKFFNRMTRWDQYLPRHYGRRFGVRPHHAMRAVGVIEIVAGLGAIFRPRIFAPVISGWLGVISGALILSRKNYDIAMRDAVLGFGALALSLLSREYDVGSVPSKVKWTSRMVTGRLRERGEEEFHRLAG